MPPSINTSAKLKADASYVVVGGTGGIGRSITQLLVERGAKHLILLSRNVETSPSSKIAIEELTEAGCNVVAKNCDISNEDDVARVKKECLQNMPPVKGAIHAAMFLMVSSPTVSPPLPKPSY